MFCVYVTFYRGKLLPPFYIGSSSIENINNGYRGSVRSKRYGAIWNQELKDNPHLFKTEILSKHDTRKAAFDKEYTIQIKLKVVKNPLYINLSLACKNGGFGGAGKDNAMYGLPKELAPCYGRTGEKHPMYGKPGYWKGKTLPPEAIKNISKNHADVSGENNPKSLKWRLTSPIGIIHECVGTIETLAKELNIGIQLLRKHLGSVVPSLSKHATHQMSKNTVGWKLEMVKDAIDTQ
jgi:hypothetical protein